MDFTQACNHMLSLPEATEGFPFGPDASVYSVRKKMFGLIAVRNGNPWLNLKCDPEEALFLRDFWEAVVPAYHMNKRHWNSVILNKTIPDAEIERMIDNSWRLVVKGLPKAQRTRLVLEK